MLVVNLMGGIGNQLFICAFGYAQAKRYQQKLYYSVYVFSKVGYQGNYRMNQWDIGDELDFINKHPFKWIPFALKRLWFEFTLRTRHADRADERVAVRYARKGYFFSDTTKYKDPLFANKLVNYYNAYFQGEKYFEAAKDEIKEKFRVKEVSARCREMAEKLLNENSVCVHIRRGDYLEMPMYNVCGKQYYIDAIEKIKTMVNNPIFYFFSNDIDWVKNNFRGEDYRFVDIAENEVEDLYMMYHCAHYIISNSSFSWWAQYLCLHEGKKEVIAPSYWLNLVLADGEVVPDTEGKAIYMDEWTLIEPTPWAAEDM